MPQGEVKACPFAHFALGPDAAAVAVHDPLNGRKANPGPLEFALGVKPLKDAEELRGVGHVEARTVVADEIGSVASLLGGPELDAGERLVSRELPRVAQQILDRCTKQRAVAPLREPVADDELRDTIWLRLFQSLGARAGELAQIHSLVANAEARDAAQREQAIDEPSHVLGGIPHALKVA